ncbi:hypothetical protein B0H13DRAFT_2379472 [Mycena leptocephala]|nr:hypothetical protein B0H13DRAFT_2379472 [Mycena leptocephala]
MPAETNTEQWNKNASRNECYSIDYIPIPNRLRDSAHKGPYSCNPYFLLRYFAPHLTWISFAHCAPAAPTPPFVLPDFIAPPRTSHFRFANFHPPTTLLRHYLLHRAHSTPRPNFASPRPISLTLLALDCPASPASHFLLRLALPPPPPRASSSTSCFPSTSRFPSASPHLCLASLHFPSALRFPSASRSPLPRLTSASPPSASPCSAPLPLALPLRLALPSALPHLHLASLSFAPNMVTIGYRMSRVWIWSPENGRQGGVGQPSREGYQYDEEMNSVKEE